MDFFRRKTPQASEQGVVATMPPVMPVPLEISEPPPAPLEKRTPFPAEAAAKSVELQMPSLGEGMGVGLEAADLPNLSGGGGINILDINKELEALKQQLAQKDSETSTLKKKLKELEAELEKAFVKERDKVTGLEEENTLLLEQLHLVQEELETVFLKGQETEQQTNTLKAQLAETTKSLEAKTAAVNEAIAAKEALAKEKNQLKFTAEALQAEKKELAADRDAKAKVLTETTAERDTLRKERDDLKARLAKSEEDKASANQELQEENELILLQLHQVQEELEHYFLENQKLQTSIEDQAKRWHRLEKRYPNYVDYDTFEPIEVDIESDTPAITWKLTNATIRGEQVPDITFQTNLHNGKAGILLNGVQLTPRFLTNPKATQEIEAFKRIRNSDMTQMLAAASAMEEFFATGQDATNPELDSAFWRQPLLGLSKDLRSLPPVFRYDRVQLKRELIHTDYEHLWCVLQNASFGKYSWPKFEFRLGAASIRPGKFSTLPKLELPLIDGKTKPFETWYEESYDDYGGKFEVRFDNTRKIFDVGAWSKLGADDQRLMVTLISLLPDAVSQLNANKIAIARSWSDWFVLVEDMNKILMSALVPKKITQTEGEFKEVKTWRKVDVEN